MERRNYATTFSDDFLFARQDSRRNYLMSHFVLKINGERNNTPA